MKTMSDETGATGGLTSGVSRRTVMKGAAWSVPVVVVASAAPAMATASSPVRIELIGFGCKFSGQSFKDEGLVKGYVFGARLVNDSGFNVTLKITSLVVGGVTQKVLGVQGKAMCNINYSTRSPATPLDVNPASDMINFSYNPPNIALPSGPALEVAVFSIGSTDSANNTIVISYEWTVDGSNPLETGSDSATASLSGDTWSGGCRPHTGWTCVVPDFNPWPGPVA